MSIMQERKTELIKEEPVKPSITELTPISNVWLRIFPFGFKNCGKNANKKIRVLGLNAVISITWTKTFLSGSFILFFSSGTIFFL